MTELPWKTRGAQLHLPRDVDVTYAVGRMGIATAYDIWPLFWGSIHTARVGLGRLLKLRLLRTFARTNLAEPAWYALAPEAAVWVAEQSGCALDELRVVTGIARANLAAVRARNRFWVSLVLACRKTEGVRIALFRPEWELRRMRPPSVHVVPDAMVVLAETSMRGEIAAVSLIEFDAGTERLSVWEAKAKCYAELRGRILYGAPRWKVVALVPSLRRARGVAQAAVRAGAGEFLYVGVADALLDGRALDAAFWGASAFATNAPAAHAESLRDGAHVVFDASPTTQI